MGIIWIKNDFFQLTFALWKQPVQLFDKIKDNIQNIILSMHVCISYLPIKRSSVDMSWSLKIYLFIS